MMAFCFLCIRIQGNTMTEVNTDILIVGAGPVGLFTVFEAGLLKMKCHLVDALPQPGGQLSEIYPKKPIYDIPGYPSILAGELVDNLMEQIAPFHPTFTLGERVESLEQTGEKEFTATTNMGTKLVAPVIIIAGGLGSFEPRKPPLSNLEQFERKGVEYIVKEPELFRGKRLVIAGGGDSALDWSIELADIASELTLIHRRDSFRGALDSVEKVMKLAEAGKIHLMTKSQATGLIGGDHLTAVEVASEEKGSVSIDADYFLPLFGLTPKLGPIGEWDLEIDKNAIMVDTKDYSTNREGIYAVGDINTYEGKLKLILCGFHEATLAVQSAFKYIYPDQKLSFKYTTVTGIKGIDG
jgi:thioredoxin reductase (NADPH)